MSLRVERVGPSQLDALRGPWNELLASSAADTVFLRWEWVRAWWDAFGANRELTVLAIRRGDALIGIAPFYAAPGPLGARYLRLCADDVEPDHLDVIFRRGEEGPALVALRNHLAGSLRRDAAVWDHVGESSLIARWAPEFAFALGAPGFQTSDSNLCPFVRVAGRYADYVRTRRELLKFELDRKWEKLQAMGVVHRTITDPAALPGAMDDLFRLHATRTGEKGVHSRFLAPLSRSFHRRLAGLLLSEGLLDLGFLVHEGRPIAAMYAFRYGGVVSFFQSGMDPAWKKWSAGAVLVNRAVQRAFDSGAREFDFLKGTEPYKSLWANAARTELRFSAYAAGPRAVLCRARDRTRFALKLAARHAHENAGAGGLAPRLWRGAAALQGALPRHS